MAADCKACGYRRTTHAHLACCPAPLPRLLSQSRMLTWFNSIKPYCTSKHTDTHLVSVLIPIEVSKPLTEHHTVILVVLKPRASLRPVAVKASSFGGRCCRIVALTRIFCLILAVDSRGDRGRASALHKSKLIQTHHAHAVSSCVPLCARRPQAGQEHY